MRPVVTPAAMAAIDAEAPEPLDELIGRAALAVARQAVDMLGGSPYGKRVAVLAGKGNNGEDGRRAVPHLERRGARCTVIEVGGQPGPAASGFDLVIDACFGTGLTRDFDSETLPITVGAAPVLAVDIPSGVDGLTGQLRGRPLRAARTVTFAALKPGLLLSPGRDYSGMVTVADIGLDCSRATAALVGPEDLLELWPRRASGAHKWQRAVYVIGGSTGMTGAPALASSAALRSGAGYVALSIPGPTPNRPAPGIVEDETAADGDGVSSAVLRGPVEAVQYPISASWAGEVVSRLDRFGAVVVGPGVVPDHEAQVVEYLKTTTTATVVDAGALPPLANLLAEGWRFGVTHVMTPHDGEYSQLTGAAPGDDRVAAATGLAERLNGVVLLKGQTTVVAHPDGRVRFSTAGDRRLATAGTGDVLSGVIASGLAGGLETLEAAALGAELHGLAGRRCRPVGMTAGDMPEAIADVLSLAER